MAPINTTPRQATQLYNAGFLDDATYNRLLASLGTATPTATPTVVPQPPQQAAITQPQAVLDPRVSAVPSVPGAAPTVNIPDAGVAPADPMARRTGASGTWEAPQPADEGSLTTDEPPAVPQAPGQGSAADDTGFTNQALGVEQQADAAMKKADIEAAGYQRMAENQQAYALENQQRELATKAELDDFAGQYRAAVDEAANTKIDPNRYWADKTTSQRVVAGIAIALGGVGAALQKSDNKNHALDLIERAIDRDIDLQKDQLTQKYQTANARGSLYSMMRGRFDDDRQARLAAQAAGLKVAELKVQSAVAQTAGEDAKGKGLQLVGQIQQKQAEKEQEILSLQANKIGVQQADDIAKVQGLDDVFKYVSRDPQKLEKYVGIETTTGYTKNPDGTLKPVKKMIAGLATDHESAKEAKNGNESYENMMNILNELRSLRIKAGVDSNLFNTNSAERTGAIKLQTAFAAAYKEAEKLGALDNGVLKLTGALVPEDPLGPGTFDPMGIFEGSGIALGLKNDNVLSSIEALQENFAEAHRVALQNHVTHFFPGYGLHADKARIEPGRR